MRTITNYALGYKQFTYVQTTTYYCQYVPACPKTAGKKVGNITTKLSPDSWVFSVPDKSFNPNLEIFSIEFADDRVDSKGQSYKKKKNLSNKVGFRYTDSYSRACFRIWKKWMIFKAYYGSNLTNYVCRIQWNVSKS